jgi:hypothetical protein
MTAVIGPLIVKHASIISSMRRGPVSVYSILDAHQLYALEQLHYLRKQKSPLNQSQGAGGQVF